jgi:hypothetical protein
MKILAELCRKIPGAEIPASLLHVSYQTVT